MFNSPAFWIVMRWAQWGLGIGNAFGMVSEIDDGRYWRAAVSLVCVLVTACWKFPKKEIDGNA